MAISRSKALLEQYLLQDIDGIDIKLLFGVYQRRVLGLEEMLPEKLPLLERIRLSRGHRYQKPEKGVSLNDFGLGNGVDDGVDRIGVEGRDKGDYDEDPEAGINGDAEANEETIVSKNYLIDQKVSPGSLNKNYSEDISVSTFAQSKVVKNGKTVGEEERSNLISNRSLKTE